MVGTHALLGKAIEFQDLGLLIVDEEQHFGVTHKERLKQLRAEVHVLTLSATPIPRTLQLALTGRARAVDHRYAAGRPPGGADLHRRRSIRVVREALLRERYRGGQSFYVCPRIEDLAGARTFSTSRCRRRRSPSRMARCRRRELEDIMAAFYDGKYDVLLSTTIVESGLDIPTANTLIVHRADMFGLAQLYQLRGRVGRSKLRAYALFTLPATARSRRRPSGG